MDRLTSAHRAENMRRIGSKGTKPEMVVRRLAYKLGYRFRLHRADLAGKPDLVFPGRRKVIFVHGCFWHSHEDPSCADGRRKPRSNLDYWLPKLQRNRDRDQIHLDHLKREGWSVLTIWECNTLDVCSLTKEIVTFLG